MKTLSGNSIQSLIVLGRFLPPKCEVDFLLRGEGRCVAITGGIGLKQNPPFSEESVNLLLSIVSSRSGISSADDLYLLKLAKVKLPFLNRSLLRYTSICLIEYTKNVPNGAIF
jgi:hypothetical protein